MQFEEQTEVSELDVLTEESVETPVAETELDGEEETEEGEEESEEEEAEEIEESEEGEEDSEESEG